MAGEARRRCGSTPHGCPGRTSEQPQLSPRGCRAGPPTNPFAHATSAYFFPPPSGLIPLSSPAHRCHVTATGHMDGRPDGPSLMSAVPGPPRVGWRRHDRALGAPSSPVHLTPAAQTVMSASEVPRFVAIRDPQRRPVGDSPWVRLELSLATPTAVTRFEGAPRLIRSSDDYLLAQPEPHADEIVAPLTQVRAEDQADQGGVRGGTTKATDENSTGEGRHQVSAEGRTAAEPGHTRDKPSIPDLIRRRAVRPQ